VFKKNHSFALNNKTDISTSIAVAWYYRAKKKTDQTFEGCTELDSRFVGRIHGGL
jgi:hypothetical protein